MCGRGQLLCPLVGAEFELDAHHALCPARAVELRLSPDCGPQEAQERTGKGVLGSDQRVESGGEVSSRVSTFESFLLGSDWSCRSETCCPSRAHVSLGCWARARRLGGPV